jgi:hypothetical protein
MFNFLKGLGFKDVSMYKSGTDYYRSVARATYEILESRLDDNPFLLLEDDVELSEWVTSMDIEIPENTDAFYFGFSKYAGHPERNDSLGYGSYQFQSVNDTYVRILNMVSAHAILFVSKRYKYANMEVMKRIFGGDMGTYTPDVLISRIQPQFNIYAYKYPFFYQSDKLGNDPFYPKDATNFRM